jgi:hypothetical protein
VTALWRTLTGDQQRGIVAQRIEIVAILVLCRSLNYAEPALFPRDSQ